MAGCPNERAGRTVRRHRSAHSRKTTEKRDSDRSDRRNGVGICLGASISLQRLAGPKASGGKGSACAITPFTGVRQFLRLGDKTEVALRKAATVAGIAPFNSADLNPLLEWAQSLGALQPDLVAEDLVDAAESKKERRHLEDKDQRIAFLSHSSADKAFIRQLAADLTANGISVWLDEQRIRVGDSIPEKIAQGLAESDYFLIGMSQKSSGSAWVQKELNNALMTEVQRRKVHIMPLKLDDTPMPLIIGDKKYADFSKSYKAGLDELITALKGNV